MRGNPIDITGQRFGRYVALHVERTASGRRGWLCQCDCGTTRVIPASGLLRGDSRSCGCAVPDANRSRGRHGYANRPEYTAWGNIIARCTRPHARGFADYGGRGIRMHEEWRRDFAAFIRDIGPRPSPEHSVDRIDTNGHYEPGNVRWATAAEQRRNTRRNRWLTVAGVTMCVADWARAAGVVKLRLSSRMDRGMSGDVIAVEIPELLAAAQKVDQVAAMQVGAQAGDDERHRGNVAAIAAGGTRG